MEDSESQIQTPLIPFESEVSCSSDQVEDIEAVDENETIEEVYDTDVPPLEDGSKVTPIEQIGDATIESLDYDPIQSIVYAKSMKEPQKRHLYGYTGLTLAKWTITIIIGILVGNTLIADTR